MVNASGARANHYFISLALRSPHPSSMGAIHYTYNRPHQPNSHSGNQDLR